MASDLENPGNTLLKEGDSSISRESVDAPLRRDSLYEAAAIVGTAAMDYVEYTDATGKVFWCRVEEGGETDGTRKIVSFQKDTLLEDIDGPRTVNQGQLSPMRYPAGDGQRCHNGDLPDIRRDLMPTTAQRTEIEHNHWAGLTEAEAEVRHLRHGPNALPQKERTVCLDLLSQFWGPMPLMIWIAVVVEAIEEDWVDFVVLMLLLLMNGFLGWYEDYKAGNAVEALKKSLKNEAKVKRQGKDYEIAADLLVPGDLIRLYEGAAVPADCEIVRLHQMESPLSVDEAALTGESVPVSKKIGAIAKMGATIQSGNADAVVFDHGRNSFMGKTAAMIQSVDEMGHFEIVLLNITFILMVVSFMLVGIALAIMINRGNDVLNSVAFCVVLLVASIPIATPVVANATMAIGSRELSKEGAIVTRLAAIEEVAGMDMLCSDKTGTLTTGHMEICQERPTFAPGARTTTVWRNLEQDDVLLSSVLAADWQSAPRDHLDNLVMMAFDINPEAEEERRAELNRLPVEELMSLVGNTVFSSAHGGKSAEERVQTARGADDQKAALVRDMIDKLHDEQAALKKPWPPPNIMAATDRFIKCAHTAFSPATKKTESIVFDTVARKAFKVSKGAPQVIADLCQQSTGDMQIPAEFWEKLKTEPELQILNKTLSSMQKSPKGGGKEWKKGDVWTQEDRQSAVSRNSFYGIAEAVVDAYAQQGTRCVSVCRTKGVTVKFPEPVKLTAAGEWMMADGGGGHVPYKPHKGWDKGIKWDWEYLGVVTFKDPARPDTKDTITKAKAKNIKIKMITGDQVAIGRTMGLEIGLGKSDHECNIQTWLGEDLKTDEKGQPVIPNDLGKKYGKKIEDLDGFAQVYPEHKFLIVESLKQTINPESRAPYCVGMTGDGVNDAPALKKATIGIAVEGATQAAEAAADIVLTRPGLSTIITAIEESRKIFQRMRNYVIYRIACTCQLLLFFFIGVVFIQMRFYTGMTYSFNDPSQSSGGGGTVDSSVCAEPVDPNDLLAGSTPGAGPSGPALCTEETQFTLPVAAMVLITVLNDGTLIFMAYDHVVASDRPEAWRLPEVFTVSITLGLVAMVSSLMMLDWALDSHNPGGVFQNAGLPALTFNQVQTTMYLKISLSDFLTVFAARTRGFFTERYVARILMNATVIPLVTSTLLAHFWPLPVLQPLPWSLILIIWLYCLGWFLFQDLMKFGLYKLLAKLEPWLIRTSAKCISKTA